MTQVIVRGETVTAGEITTDNSTAPVAPCSSVTCTVTGNVPADAGAPEIVPDDGFKVRPGGRVPCAADHWKGEVPPAACNVYE